MPYDFGREATSVATPSRYILRAGIGSVIRLLVTFYFAESRPANANRRTE